MTAKFISSSSVAYYNTASRLNGLIDIPSYAASEIIFPKSSKAFVEEGENKVKYLYERMVAILLSFTIPASLFILIFPKFVIDIIASNKYEAAAPILQLYMITGLLRPMQNQAANLLNSMGKTALCFLCKCHKPCYKSYHQLYMPFQLWILWRCHRHINICSNRHCYLVFL